MLAIVPAFFLFPAAIAKGQAQSEAQLDRFNQQMQETEKQSRLLVDQSIPAGDRVLFDYGGYLTAAHISLDDPTGYNHTLQQFELVGYADLNLDGANDFFFRFHSLYNDFDAGDSFSGKRDDYVTPRIERAYYRFDLQRSAAAYQGKTLNYNAVFTGGRQLVNWGNGVSLNEVVDGATSTFSWGPVSLDAVAGVSANFNTDFDTSRPSFRTHTHRGFYGGKIDVKAAQQHIYAYGLEQADYNDDPAMVSHSVSTRFKYNSYYIGAGAGGNLSDNLLYGVEVVYEGGSTLSNSFVSPTDFTQVKQTDDRIAAYALDGRLDYVVADPNKTRFGAEVIAATGDSDRFSTNTTLGGNRPGTVDHAFNAAGLLNTGLSFSPAVSNIIVERVGASTFPFVGTSWFREAQVGVDVFAFEKFQRTAPIDEPTTTGRYLGTEADLYANWQITSDLSFALRYGVFWAGSPIAGDRVPRAFSYMGFTYAF